MLPGDTSMNKNKGTQEEIVGLEEEVIEMEKVIILETDKNNKQKSSETEGHEPLVFKFK